VQDLFRHLRIHCGTKKMKDDEICYIHKIAYTKTETEEPIPFAGVVKLTTYKCPMCATPIEGIEYATDNEG
tara:strand:- start:243 stop:455 length:213 start_codon:yes stop_codon:yes gene_type:complete